MKDFEGFTTTRLRLRQPQLDDAPAIFERWTQDPDVARFVTWVPHTSVDITTEFMRVCKHHWGNEKSPHAPFAIERVEEGDLIGMFDISALATRVSIGYCMAKDVWGNGYMTELVDAVATEALRRKGIYRMDALVDVENTGSSRVLEKAGFEREGIFRKYGVHPNLGSEPRDLFSYARVKA